HERLGGEGGRVEVTRARTARGREGTTETAVVALLVEEVVHRLARDVAGGATDCDDPEGLADGVGVVARREAAVDRQVGEPARLDGAEGVVQQRREEVESSE